MAINTKKVTGRRSLKYRTLDDLLEEAGRLSAAEVMMLGNWSLGQVFRHLALAINGSMDGFSFRMSFPVVLASHLFLKKWMLARGFPAGFRLFGRGASVMPGETSTADGLAALRAAITRFKRGTARFPHPVFGKMSSNDWHQFHLRHAELHLSFALPQTN